MSCRCRNSSNRRTGHIIAALHLAQDLLPVHIVILGFFPALTDQFLQDRLTVLDGVESIFFRYSATLSGSKA